MNIKQEIVDSIDILVDSIVKKNTPTIMYGVCMNVLQNNRCTMRIHDVDYNISYYGGVPIVNHKYPVFLPANVNMGSAFMIVGEDNYYRAGDTYESHVTSSSQCCFAALISATSTNIRMTITTPNSLKYIKNVTVDRLIGALRVPSGGYISDGSTASNSSKWKGADGSLGSNISRVSAEIIGENMVSVTIVFKSAAKKDSTTTTVTNNTPISAYMDFKLTFS